MFKILKTDYFQLLVSELNTFIFQILNQIKASGCHCKLGIVIFKGSFHLKLRLQSIQRLTVPNARKIFRTINSS